MTAQESIENKQLQASPEGANSAKLDSALEGLQGNERVSEIVAEKPQENMGDSVSVKGDKNQNQEDSSIQSLSSNAPTVVQVSIAAQKRRIRKVLMKKQTILLKEVKKLEKSKHFSASKMESLVVQLRKIHFLLHELVSAAKGRIHALYEQFVVGKG